MGKGRPRRFNSFERQNGNYNIKSQIPTKTSYYINVKCSVLKNYTKLDKSELYKHALRLIHKHIFLQPRFILDIITPDNNKWNKSKTGTITLSLCLFRPLTEDIEADRDESIGRVEQMLPELEKLYGDFDMEVIKPFHKKKKKEEKEK